MTINESLTKEIKANHKKRIDNGHIEDWSDSNEYLVSPGYTSVEVKEYRKYLATIGMKNAV